MLVDLCFLQVRVKTIEEAIDHTNANNLALQGCVFTQDINQAIYISDAMETGTVQVRAAAAAAAPRLALAT